MYAFFTKTIIIDKETPPIRQHEGDNNAHFINKELMLHISTSTKPSLESFIILTYITTARIWNWLS